VAKQESQWRTATGVRAIATFRSASGISLRLASRHATASLVALALIVAMAGCDDAAYPNYPHTMLNQEEQAVYNAVIAELVGAAGPGSGLLDRFWASVWPGVKPNSSYANPVEIVAYEGRARSSGCGSLSSENAWYCHADNTIYYDSNFFRYLFRHMGRAAPSFILAHEWGHHIQSQVVLPGVSVRAELQADCYAGVFFGRGYVSQVLNIDDYPGVGLGILQSGDRDYRASQWFQEGVHGPASWRAKAFVDGSLGEPAFCRDYEQWTDRGTEQFGAYRWLPAPGIDVQRNNGVITGSQRGLTAYIASAGLAGTLTAVTFMPTAFESWFRGSSVRPVGSVVGITTAGRTRAGGILGGTGAAQGYTYTDMNGQHHGVLFIHVSTTGEAAGVSVVRAGPPPSPDGPANAAWNAVVNYMYVVGFGLCPRDGAGALCIALGSR